MKRCLAFVMTIAIFIAGLFNIIDNSKNVKAYEATINIGTVTCRAGEQVVVPIEIDGEIDFCNIGIEIDYDTDYIELISVKNTLNAAAMFTLSQNLSITPCNMDWSSGTGIRYSGKIAELTFRVNDTSEAGLSVISVDYYKGRNGQYVDGIDVNYDGEEKSLELGYVSGSIQIIDSIDPTPTAISTPTAIPTETPTVTSDPIGEPTKIPFETASPTEVPIPTVTPIIQSTTAPQITVSPTTLPTTVPTPIKTPVVRQTATPPFYDTTNNPAQSNGNNNQLKSVKLSSVKCKKGAKKITGKVSVSKATVMIKVGKKAYKKAVVNGKKFMLKVTKLKKKTKIVIKVTKSGYKNMKKIYRVK